MAKTSNVPSGAKIKVIGLGGGGCNAVTRMVREQIHGIEFIAMNTDAKSLAITEAPIRIQLGENCTRGLGAGGDYQVGQKAADESRDEIKEVLQGADMIFITAGMGGGTGTGAAPIVADLAKKSGALTITIVTKPFSFEGNHRIKVAEEGIRNLLEKVDTLVIIPNDRLLQLCDNKSSVDSAFKLADQVLHNGVQAITEVVTVPGLINLDFADIRAIMKDAGPAWMSIGKGSGQNRAVDAAKSALSSPLLDVSMDGATGVLFNVTGGSDLSLFEVNNAAEVIQKAVSPDANIIFGVVLNPALGNDVTLTIIATGFKTQRKIDYAKWEQEMGRFLKAGNETGLDTPTFLRNHNLLQNQRVQPTTSLKKSMRQQF